MSYQTQNIILACFTKIGDRVQMNVNKEDRLWSGKSDKLVPNGTLGTIVGYYERTEYQDITTYPWKEPGKYRGNGNPYVLWDNGESDCPSLHNICFADEAENHTHDVRAKDMAYREIFDTTVRVGDLPNTKYWKGAVVKMVRNIFNTPINEVVIKNIDYHQVGEFCNDGVTPMPIYDVCPVGEIGISTRVSDNDIDILICNGNYWAWQNDKSQLSFKDLQEELAFYMSIGKLREVKNKRTKTYGWTLDELLEDVQSEEIDGIRMSYGLFGAPSRPVGMKFEPGFEELAKRCRDEVLKGFSIL